MLSPLFQYLLRYQIQIFGASVRPLISSLIRPATGIKPSKAVGICFIKDDLYFNVIRVIIKFVQYNL